jgi:hypothetical protein
VPLNRIAIYRVERLAQYTTTLLRFCTGWLAGRHDIALSCLGCLCDRLDSMQVVVLYWYKLYSANRAAVGVIQVRPVTIGGQWRLTVIPPVIMTVKTENMHAECAATDTGQRRERDQTLTLLSIAWNPLHRSFQWITHSSTARSLYNEP